MLGLRWRELDFDGKGIAQKLDVLVIEPTRRLAGKTIDAEAILGGIFSWDTINEKVIKAYDEYLFDGATVERLN
ncbi:MAG: hypothetical protein ABIQ35_03690 [Verrucomicrobiota bacterium]